MNAHHFQTGVSTRAVSCKYPLGLGCSVDGTPCQECPMQFFGTRKQEAEASVPRHMIASVILVLSIALLGAIALGVVGQVHHYHEIQIAGRV